MNFFKILLSAALIGSAFIYPAYAQDRPPERQASPPREAPGPLDTLPLRENTGNGQTSENPEARRLLALQIHELRPITTQVSDALDYIGSELAPQERQIFRDNVMENMDLDQLQEASVNAMVQVFTAPELATMAEYYSKSESQAIEAKSAEYRQRIDPVIVAEINSALSRLQAAMAEANPNPAPLRPVQPAR